MQQKGNCNSDWRFKPSFFDNRQYFDYRGKGISSRILDIETVPDETLVNLEDDQLQKYIITEKCDAFSGDNCNTNFGGKQRVGTNNVFFKLKKKLS